MAAPPPHTHTHSNTITQIKIGELPVTHTHTYRNAYKQGTEKMKLVSGVVHRTLNSMSRNSKNTLNNSFEPRRVIVSCLAVKYIGTSNEFNQNILDFKLDQQGINPS